MNRYAMVLEELGLAPQWRLRNRAADRRAEAPAPVVEAPAAEHLPREARIASMDWIQLKAAVRECTACKLHAARTQAVIGVGDEAADWLFVGEGPGAEEDARGEPFVGQAGRLLDNMLLSLGLRRGQD